MTDLRQYSLIYLATPYSKYPGGIEAAFIAAAQITAAMLREGMKVYSPIAHTHPIAVYGQLDPYDHAIWLPFDAVMMSVADAMVVAELAGWESSFGIKHEIAVFTAAGKPIHNIDPMTLALRQ